MTCRLPLCLVVSGLAMMVVAGPRLQARSEAAAVQEDPQSVVVRLRAELSRPSATWENYLDLAAALERADLQAEATRTLEQGIRRFPDNLTLWSRLGLSLWKEGRHAEAAEVFRHLVEETRRRNDAFGEASAWYQLGQVEYSRGRPLESLVAARRALELGGRKAEFYHLLGLASYELHQDSDAESAFRQAITLAPEDARLQFNLALVLLRRRDLATAERILSGVTRAAPDFAEGAYYLGRIYNNQHRNRQALELFQRAERLNPHLDGLYLQKGLALKALGQDAEAAESLSRHLQQHPEDVSALISLGDCHLRRADWTRAIPPLERAVELEPGRAAAHFLLGRALLETGDEEGAVRHLEAAAAASEESEEPHFLLARIYRRRGDLERADRHLELYRQKKGLAEFRASQQP
jgi:tetratricopeptide (TPR) repeat protein